jgi:hypothetical protein
MNLQEQGGQCLDRGCNGCGECVNYEGDDEAKCPECDGDGGDKWNDYSLPCPKCGGDGRLW